MFCVQKTSMAPPKKQFLRRAKEQKRKRARANDALRKVARRKRAHQMDNLYSALNTPDDRKRLIRHEINNASDAAEAGNPDDIYRQSKMMKRLDQNMRGDLKPVYFT